LILADYSMKLMNYWKERRHATSKPVYVYFPDASDVENFVNTKGLNSFYESVITGKNVATFVK
jgi:hypothetical protein